MAHKWSRKIYRMMLLWLNQIGNNRKLHHQVSIELAAKASRYNFYIIVLAGISSLVSFLGVFGSNPVVKIVLPVVSGIASTFAVVLSSIISMEGFEQKAEKHKQVAAQYCDLSNLIQALTLIDNKPDPEQFIRRIVDQFHFIEQFNPELLPGESSTADLPNLILLGNAKRGRITDIINDEDKHIFDKHSPDDNDLDEVVTESENADNISSDNDIEDLIDKAISGNITNYSRKVSILHTPMRQSTFGIKKNRISLARDQKPRKRSDEHVKKVHNNNVKLVIPGANNNNVKLVAPGKTPSPKPNNKVTSEDTDE